MTDKPNLLIVAKGGIIILVGVIIENILRLPVGIILARFLGPEQLGFYQITISAIFVLAAISLFGFRMSLIRFIPVYLSSRDMSGLLGITRMGVILPLFFSTLLSLALFASAPYLSLGFYDEQELIPLLRAASFILPVWTVTSVLSGIMQGHQKMHYFVLANKICLPFIRLTLFLLLVLTALMSPLTALYSFGISVLCGASLMFYWAVKMGILRSGDVAARYDIQNIRKFAIPIYVSSLLLFVGPNMKLLLIGFLASSVEVGIYTPVYEISIMAALVYNSIIVAASPKVAELHYQDSKKQLEDSYKTLSKWVMVINLPVFLIVIIWAKPLLMIFGEEFLPGTLALQIMAIAGLINVPMGISPVLISMTGNANLKLINTFLLYIIMFSLDWYFIPVWGLGGAAASFLIATIVVSVIRMYQVFNLFNIHPFTYEYYKPITGASIALVAIWAISKLIVLETVWLQSLLGISFFLTVYGITIITFGFKREEREIAVNLISSVRTSLRRR